MGGCCCSSRKDHLNGTQLYYHFPPILEEHDALPSSNVASSAFTTGLLVDLDLEVSTFRAPPTPLPFDVVLGYPQSTEFASVKGKLSRSSFETLATCEDLEETECIIQSSSLIGSPRKSEISKWVLEEEDACPICLEEYDEENPKLMTKCQHHFHLSCILEWMERSNSCPNCDQEMKFEDADDRGCLPLAL